MKKVIIAVIVLAFASCNVPKQGEEENIPTNKLEVLTNLADDTTKVDSTAKH
jgi:hypothetical protein